MNALRSSLVAVGVIRIIFAGLGSGCGPSVPPGSDSATGGSDSGSDSGGGGTDAGGVVFPNGIPGAETLYFRGSCQQGFCTDPVFDTWHEGTITECAFDGTQLSVRTSMITDGAYSFWLDFAVSGPTKTLDPNSTSVDWSHPDGASAFLWFNDMAIPTHSSGTLQFDSCGGEVVAVFQLLDLCEYHGCSFDPWITNVEGAFRCTPTMVVDCGL